MVKKVTLSLLMLLIGGSFLFWTQSLAFAAPNPQTATPTPAAEEEASVAAEPTIADLLSRVEALETQVTALEEEITASEPAVTSLAQAFRVTTAVYLLDNAGLHDLDVRLNEEGEILPADAGRVARVGRLLSAVDWPMPLAEDAETLTGLITDLSAALSDDDVSAAAPLATEVHDVGHGLSHAAEHWLQEAAHEGNDSSQHDEHAVTEDAANGDANSEDAPTDDDNANSDSSDGG